MTKDNLPSPIRNPYHKARLNILYSASWFNEYIRSFFEQFDLTAQQYNILRIIQKNEQPLSVLQIREQMFEKMSDASRLVDRLVIKELARKEISGYDKRLIEVFLTEKGHELLSRIAEKIEEIDQPLSGISYEEADQISELLEKMRENYKITPLKS